MNHRSGTVRTRLLALAGAALLQAARPAEACAQEAAAVVVGRPPPALEIEQLLGAPADAVATWDGLRGQVVVLEFWATWCAPCLAAFPHINELADAFRDEPVRFVAVTDEPEAKVRACLARHEIRTWIGLDTDGSVFQAFGVRSIPRTVVIGADGLVAAVTEPFELTAERLRGYVAGTRDDAGGAPAPAPLAPAGGEAGAPSQPGSLLEISVRETTRPGGFELRRGSLELRGTALGDALALLHQLPSRAWVVGPADLLDRRVAVKASLPDEAADRLRPLVQSAVCASFGIEASLAPREAEVFVLSAPGGPGADLHQAGGIADGMASEDAGLLVGQNAGYSGLLHELELRLGRPLVDETGLQGAFDWNLRFTEGDRDSLLSAMQEQLGLVATPARRTVTLLEVRRS